MGIINTLTIFIIPAILIINYQLEKRKKQLKGNGFRLNLLDEYFFYFISMSSILYLFNSWTIFGEHILENSLISIIIVSYFTIRNKETISKIIHNKVWILLPIVYFIIYNTSSVMAHQYMQDRFETLSYDLKLTTDILTLYFSLIWMILLFTLTISIIILFLEIILTIKETLTISRSTHTIYLFITVKLVKLSVQSASKFRKEKLNLNLASIALVLFVFSISVIYPASQEMIRSKTIDNFIVNLIFVNYETNEKTQKELVKSIKTKKEVEIEVQNTFSQYSSKGDLIIAKKNKNSFEFYYINKNSPNGKQVVSDERF